MRLVARLRDRFLNTRRAEVKVSPAPLSDSFRWPALGSERDPDRSRESGSRSNMNGATALGIHNTHNSGQGVGY
jgi:hypothetical protein